MNTIKVALMSVINSKNFKLMDVQRKIKEFYASNDLTEDEKNELLEVAIQAANPDGERPDYQQMFEGLAARIETLEKKIANIETGEEEDNPADTEIPAWKPWDGISKDYVYGAKVAHKGKIWISDFQGQNTWEPGIVGTENLWIEWTDEAA